MNKNETLCDVIETLEVVRQVGPWKKLFFVVYRHELKRTGNREEAKELALKAVNHVKRTEAEETQPPAFLRANASAAFFRVDAALTKKSRLGYVTSPVSARSITGWNLLRMTSVHVRCFPFGKLLWGSLGSLSILFLLGGLWLATHPKDIITLKLIKSLSGQELTCLDLSEDQWRGIPGCE